MPSEMSERDVVVVDPMLATGNSAAAAVARIKQLNPKSIKFVCLLAAPEGDEPRVGIFLVGSRSMRPGTIDIQRGSGTSGPSQTFRFHIQVRPVATCG